MPATRDTLDVCECVCVMRLYAAAAAVVIPTAAALIRFVVAAAAMGVTEQRPRTETKRENIHVRERLEGREGRGQDRTGI